MRRNARCPRPEVLVPRRGNSIVLVMGILVLLVIIATAFITRTQAGRVTSSVMVRSMLRDDNARATAEMLAYEIGAALFPFPVDPDLAGVDVPENSNTPRLSQRQLDLDGDGFFEYSPVRYGTDPTTPYNFAPYHVVPYTNWPDAPPGGPADPFWPDGPGNDGGGLGDLSLIAEGNPVGNPGFSDTRWLADHEPLRWTTNGNATAFSHWRHMTNLARPNNGWRICRNISDITDANPNVVGGIVENLSLPVEQWLVVQPVPALLDLDALFNSTTGDTFYNENHFNARWADWFLDYGDVYYDPQTVPPNFYNLSDLNANGNPLELGERPQDEFVAGSARHAVSSILVDTDGDGFTDSFWFLAPTMTERGIRQIVAVRIIDNSAMLNVNVATRFNRVNTVGATPADLALIGQNNTDEFTSPADTWNVGYFDNHAHWEGNPPPPDGDGTIFFPGFFGSATSPDSPYGTSVVRFRDVRWDNINDNLDFLSQIGVDDHPSFTPGDELGSPSERLLYWQFAGSNPLNPGLGLTPFGLTEELELRMFHGQNYPWILSRFERAVNTRVTSNAFLHSTNDPFNDQIRQESNEYLEQLSNIELAFDHRRNLTVYNGARNDQMPPWLWLFASPNADNNGDFVIDGLDFDLWLDGARKFDLRLPPVDLDNDGIVEDDFDGDGDVELDPDDVRLLGENLRDRLERALVDVADESYYGSGAGSLDDTRLLAAALAANILAYRDLHDPNDDALLAEAVAVEPAIGPLFPRFLGLERQPFLLEAFIGHVYETYVIPGDPDGFGYLNSGNRIILEDDDGGNSLQSTVVVVQIANPYDQPIILHDPSNPNLLPRYEIELFDQTPISLEAIAEALGPDFYELPPARDGLPSTMILYSIDPTLAGAPNFGGQWLNFLDIELGDHPAGVGGTIIVNLQDPALAIAVPDPWDTDRDTYDDDGALDEAVQLIRKYDPQGTATSVVIDRIDDPGDPDFLDEVHAQGNPAVNKPPTYLDLGPIPPMNFQPDQMLHPTGGWEPPYQIGTHWVQWVRISRAWGNDDNGDGLTNPSERNPRYIYASTKQTTAADPSILDPRPDYPVRIFGGAGFQPGVSFSLANNPDNEPGDLNLPWITLDHTPAGGVPAFARKPTFFDMNRGLVTDYPDKGYYHSTYSLQMLQKDRDFEQVGELLNVWLYGHELEFDIPGAYVATTETFSEFMIDTALVGIGERVNRLRVEPELVGGGNVIGVGDPANLLDPLHSVPTLPAGARVLDAFVCDDRGLRGTVGVHEFGNANGFTGKITPGLINVNTAGPTVLRSAPHMARLVHELDSPSANPFVRVPEAIVRYRERFGDPADLLLPGYGNRGGVNFLDNPELDDLRGDRGFASLGELMLLLEQPTGPALDPLNPNENWRIDFAGQGAFVDAGNVESSQISTDVNDLPGNNPDLVAQDAEELNLLFAGMSNMLTTRSDVFTVYFRVRSFIQNPTTRVWDATNPEFIVDDSRYVMLVDRSEVNHPNDKPKILYLEKLPK